MKYFLSNGDLLYTRALLFTWEPISSPTVFTQTNGKFFIKQLENVLKAFSPKHIVVNCNQLSDVDDHALKPILEFASQHSISFIFYSTDNEHQLYDYTQKHILDDTSDIESRVVSDVGRFFIIKKSPDFSKLCLDSIKKEAENLQKEKVKNVVESAYRAEDNIDFKLTSTPLEASGHFNANLINSDPFNFRWVISLIAERVQYVAMKRKLPTYTIVASSLRGAAIAASVREILYYRGNVKFKLFDHFGPKHDFRNTPSNHAQIEGADCFYVGDFLIGGTEVKLTQAYCKSLGGKLTDAFVIGKFTTSQELGNGIKGHCLVQLGECVTDLWYRLK